MKRILPFLFPVFLFVPWVWSADASEGDRTLTIFYTGAEGGEIEPCGCSPKTDFGGLPRRAGYLESERQKLGPNLLIDSGNFSAEDTPQGRLKTEAMVEGFRAMRYDAVAFLERERTLPADFLDPLLRKSGLRIVGKTGETGVSILDVKGVSIRLSVDPAQEGKESVRILLTGKPLAEAQKISAGWDLVILSSGETLEEPVRTGESVIVSGYPKGERLGIVTLSLDSRGKVIRSDHRWQLLGTEIRKSAAVRSILDDYNRRVAILFAEEERKPLSEGPYLGVDRCRECHLPFVESWKKTRHAGAWGTLERVGKTHDPECIQCHVVGFNEPGGFQGIKGTPGLVNVQCEVCHGPGKEHVEGGYGAMREMGVSTCLRCHVPGHSPDFEYRSYREKILHRIE